MNILRDILYLNIKIIKYEINFYYEVNFLLRSKSSFYFKTCFAAKRLRKLNCVKIILISIIY